MTMRSWIRNLFTRPATRTIRKAPRRACLNLEALEDRWVPSTFTVLNTNDSGDGSLRAAVAAANNTAGPDTIDFAVSGTISLGGTQLELTDTTGETTITGPGANLLSISGGGLSRVLQVVSLVKASISGLTITGGNAVDDPGNGGGLSNFGNTTLSNCNISENKASYLGGAVFCGPDSTTTLTDCTVSGNSAVYGGGLQSYGALALNHCTLSNNSADHGGALATSYGTTTLTDCTVSGNNTSSVSGVSGGGLFLFGGQTTLTNCTVSGNSAKRGGALWSRFGTVQLVNSTVSGNTARTTLGGGVYSDRSNVTLQNCTISGNSAPSCGG